MTAPIFIASAEVARLLELPNANAFLARRGALERDHGFPAAAPWTRSPMKWRRADVLAWRDGFYAAPDLAPAVGPAAGDAARRVVLLSLARRA